MHESLTLKICNSADSAWDQQLLLGKTESLYLYHSTHWADRLKELLGYKPIYFSVYKGDELQLILLAFIGSSSILPFKGGFRNTLKKIVKNAIGHKNFIWYGQPVFFKEENEESYTFLADALDNFMKKEKLRLSRGEWPLSQKSSLSRNWKTAIWATLKVDLSRDLDAIYASFKPSARKEIRKAEQKGVVVKRVANIEELEEYYKFACKCAKRYRKHLIGFKDFSTMWDHFRGWGYFETFVAYHSGKMAGGLSVWGDKHCLIEIGSFQSEECFRKKLSSSDLIKWEVIKWGKSVNATSFDLSGINPFPKSSKEKGIKQFKEKWSGRYHEYLILRN